MSTGGGRSPRVPKRLQRVYLLLMPAVNSPLGPALRATLSAPRMSTYLTATGGDEPGALSLYGWNASVSAALLLPIHFAEVSTRNAAADALVAVHGDWWPWDAGFERSLPAPTDPRIFNPRKNLVDERDRHGTAGKIIAELKFSFWEDIFTRRHDVRIWNPHIKNQFSHALGTPAEVRLRVHSDLEIIRKLRNRLAHHEPIFKRNLESDLTQILDLISIRSPETASWVRRLEKVTPLLGAKPKSL